MEESVAQAHKQKIYDATKTKKTKTSGCLVHGSLKNKRRERKRKNEMRQR